MPKHQDECEVSCPTTLLPLWDPLSAHGGPGLQPGPLVPGLLLIQPGNRDPASQFYSLMIPSSREFLPVPQGLYLPLPFRGDLQSCCPSQRGPWWRPPMPPTAIASGYRPAHSVMPLPWPSLTSSSQRTPEHGPDTWLLLPTSLWPQGWPCPGAGGREYESCCPQIAWGGRSLCTGPVHCHHPCSTSVFTDFS